MTPQPLKRLKGSPATEGDPEPEAKVSMVLDFGILLGEGREKLGEMHVYVTQIIVFYTVEYTIKNFGLHFNVIENRIMFGFFRFFILCTLVCAK